MAEGKKSRKFGRNSKRPSQVRYRSELRMDKNKRLNIEVAKNKAIDDCDKFRYGGKTKRGTARFLRRGHSEQAARELGYMK